MIAQEAIDNLLSLVNGEYRPRLRGHLRSYSFDNSEIRGSILVHLAEGVNVPEDLDDMIRSAQAAAGRPHDVNTSSHDSSSMTSISALPPVPWWKRLGQRCVESVPLCPASLLFPRVQSPLQHRDETGDNDGVDDG